MASTVVPILVLLLLAVIPAKIASRKGHSFVSYYLLGVLLFIVALPMSIIVKPNKRTRRQCPSCREWIDRQATACPHCGRDVPPVVDAVAPDSSERAIVYTVLVLTGFGLIFIAWLLLWS